MKAVLPAILACLALTGCLSTSKMVPLDEYTPSVDTYFQDGDEIAVSRGQSTLFSVSGQKTNSILTIETYVYNGSTQSTDFSPRRIEVYGVENGAPTRLLHTYTAAEFMKRIRRRQNLAYLMSATGKAIQEGEPQYETESFSGHAVDTNGNVYRVQGSVIRRDKDAEQAVRDANDAELQRELDNYLSFRTRMESTLLKKTTVFPGESLYGNVKVKMDDFDAYLIRTSVGDERHEIWFELEATY